MICPKCHNDTIEVVCNKTKNKRIYQLLEVIVSVSCNICDYSVYHKTNITQLESLVGIASKLHDIFERGIFRKFVRSIDENVCRNLSSDVFISNNEIRITSLSVGNAITAVVKHRDLLLSKSITSTKK